MSNPFATFRKNQNYWMAGLVLLSILAFVVAPAIMQVQDSLRGGGAENAVVVRWNGGRLTVADLQNQMQKHGGLVRFLSTLAREVVDKGGEPDVPGFRYDPQTKQIIDLGIQASSTEEGICRTRILAEKARRLGVEFTDDAIDDFILAYCDGRVSTNRIAQLLRESSDGRLSNFDVRELLKQELAAMVVLSTGTTGLYANVPGETYQDFLKLNQTAKVEAFPVFVADHIDEVKNSPSSSEVQAIYELGSNRIADPNSSEPGFVLPYQANLEFVEANLQEWVEREKTKLTEEQLRAEYDRRVALEQLKVPVDTPSTTADPNADAPADAEAPPAPAAAENAQEPGTSPEPTAEPPAAGATENSETEAPPAPPAAESAPAEDQAPASPAAGEAPVTEGSLELSPPSPDSADQSARRRPRIHLVSANQADDGLPPPVEQPPQLDADADAASSPDASATSDSTQAPATENGEGTSAAAEQSNAPAASSGPVMRTQTFEEARDQIATSLAQSTAFESLEVPLAEIQRAMTEYYGAYQQYAAFRDHKLPADEKSIEEPRRPNLKKIAEDAGLKYGQTGLSDGYKLVQTQLGMSDIRDEGMGLSGSVASTVMNPQLPLFQPLQSSYIDREAAAMGNLQFFQYLFWKTEERPVTVPELDDIRQQVVDYWKQLQARRLAENEATALAKKVNGSSETPWKDALSTTEQALVIETDPFTWISRMGDYHMPTTVNKLDNVGSEFMQSVFGSGPGQVIVAPNQSKSVYYVTRVVEFTPDPAELQQRFAADPDKRGPMAIAQEENGRLAQAWLENLYDEMGVEFEIPLNSL